MIWSKVAISVW